MRKTAEHGTKDYGIKPTGLVRRRYQSATPRPGTQVNGP